MEHISNKEKARRLAKYFASETDYKESAAYSAAMEMAQWKDEQEIEFLQSLMFQASTQQSLNIIIKNRIKLLKGE